MSVRVRVEPALLRWAVDRAGWSEETIVRRAPRFSDWVRGYVKPTLKQLESFASATHTPIGSLFLTEPPEEPMPIPDMRTFRNTPVAKPSVDLLDTIYICQSRQDWYREYANSHGYPELGFVGSARTTQNIQEVAGKIRHDLSFEFRDRAEFGSFQEALRSLIDRIEELGVLVMINGVVGANTHRKLNPEEFRGFALADSVAPVIFVNGADTKSAQIFTIVHELAHIWLGGSALSDAAMVGRGESEEELWCNQVAAEVLVPRDTLLEEYLGSPTTAELERLAKRYRVSTLVILKRLHDARYLDWDTYQEEYSIELQRISAAMQNRTASSGGNFYNTQPIRLSRQFARAVITDTLEGGTAYRDAYQLLGTKKHQTFENLATEIGVV